VSDDGVRRRGGGSGGWRWRVRGPAAPERQGGEKKCKKLQGLVARGGAHRGAVDGGGARLESARESGLPVAGGGGLGVGSGGEARALERRGQRGMEMGGRVERCER
jgi:hypothetical protein